MKDLIISGLGGALTGLTHYTAHMKYGDSTVFEQAGVTEAGIAVSVIAFLGTYLTLNLEILEDAY